MIAVVAYGVVWVERWCTAGVDCHDCILIG